jgi:hypothetical protein
MIRPAQLRDDVIIPVVSSLIPLQHDQGGNNLAAITELLLGTAMQESHCGDYLDQVRGPALGIWQMEPASEKDIWDNFLAFRPDIRVPVTKLMVSGIDRTKQLEGNLYYACAMARVEYLRAPAALPAAGDLEAQAEYYVKYYNRGGAANVNEYIANWKTLQAALAQG